MFQFLLFFLVLTNLSLSHAHTGFQIWGHRGARSVRAENSLSGFRYALENEIDFEVDLMMTVDEELVVYHDATLSSKICRTDDGKKPRKGIRIQDITFSQLSRYSCGSVRDPKFPQQKVFADEKVPLFSEVMDLIQEMSELNPDFRLNIEIKVHNREVRYQRIFDLLHEMLLRYNFPFDQFVLQSFDIHVLSYAKNVEPNITTSLLSILPSVVRRAESIGVDIVSPNHHFIDRGSVQRLRENGFRVVPWTANSISEWQRLIDVGVDGIITDDPVRLRAWL